MIAFRKTPLSLLASVVAFVFAAGALLAQERQFPNYNCALTLPEGWHWLTNLPPQKGLVAACENPETSRLVMLLIFNQKPAAPLDDRFIAEFDRGVQQSGGGERTSGKYIEIAGIKAYERLGTARVNGQPASTLIHLVPADGRYISVEAMLLEGDASSDPGLRQVVESFRFLQPPVESYTGETKSYQIGRLVGMLLVISAVTFFIIKSRRGRPASPPQVPPAPPPTT